MPTPNGYQVTETIFSNRYTQVFRARRDSDGLSVILRTSGEQALPSQCARLSYVADVLKKFQHPNISALIEWLDTPGQCCLVLEDIHAIDLRHYLERFDQQRLPLEIFWPLAIQLAEALSVIHHEHVIHKDLHPRNIVVNSDTLHCQIIDFGLASLLSREQPTLTSPNQLEGSLSFLSPEQTGRMNRSLDYRTDFYTLGATLYLSLTGRVPFEAEDALGLVYAHMAIKQTPVKELRPDVPQALSKLIDKLLSKNAEDRYQSAQGLKHDLEAIRELVAKAVPESEFQLAQEDNSGRFMVPQLLYGREQEVSILIDQFRLAADGVPSLLLVEGYSGVGKSALVHEIHQSIAEQGGLFIEGKFNQFQQNAAYSVIRHALESWLNQILSFSEEQLQALRASILMQLSGNARVLIDFLPAFKYLLGDLPLVPRLGAKESQARFQLVMKQFFKLASSKHPIVLFVDDLQWADRATLTLLPALLNEADCHLLIIGAYRDNEVDALHPVREMLASIAEQEKNTANSRLTHLKLEPLAASDINRLLGDTFTHCAQPLAPLAQLIQEKTNGNPFFIIEFIRTLYNDGLINFDLAAQCWRWDILDIEQQGITDNVATLMLGKMQDLPEKTQALLRTAACLGTRFAIKTLAKLVEQDESEVTLELWPALEQGLLLQEGGSGLFASHLYVRTQSSDRLSDDALESGSDVTFRSPSSISQSIRTSYNGTLYCRFLHDRMLQAAYESIAVESRPALHLKIGRILLAELAKPPTGADTNTLNQPQYLSQKQGLQLPEISNDLVLFDIVEHLNQGLELITEADERLALAELNCRAAAKALENSVWYASLAYSETAIGLLPDNAWREHYDLCFEVHRINAESNFLVGQMDRSDQLYEALLEHTNNALSKAEIYTERLVQSIGSARWQKGIEQGEQGLALLGINIPSIEREASNLEMEAFFLSMPSRALEKKLKNLPENTDKAFQLAMYLLPNMSLVSGVLSVTANTSFFCYQAMKLTLERGCTEFTHLVLACFAMQISRSGRFDLNKVSALAAMNYMEQYPDSREQANTYNLLAGGAFCIFSSYDEALKLHERGEQIGLRNGEQGRADINYFNRVFLLALKGVPLSDLYGCSQEILDSGRLQRTFSAVPIVHSKLAESLLKGDDANALEDARFPARLIELIQGTLHHDYLMACRAKLAFWYDDEAQTLVLCDQVHESLLNRFYMYWVEDHCFLYAMLLATKKDKSQLEQQRFEKIYTQTCAMEEIYSPNFGYKRALINAELAKHKGAQLSECMMLYEQAINAAMENGFLHYAALANERFADYLQVNGHQRFARVHAELAYRFYSEWGCAPKLNNMARRFPFLAADDDASQYDVSSNRYTSQHRDSSLPRSLSSHSGLSRFDLDIASIMKSAQAISSELTLDGLLAKVMDVILENTGAQLGALVLLDQPSEQDAAPHKAQALIEAYINRPLKQQEILQHEPVQGSGKLPEAIIRRVLRSGDSLNLAHACQEGAYMNEAYIKQTQAKSILCVPMVYRDKGIGVLYLENNVSVGAFTDKRLKLIKLLLSQAAISLENARLFNEVITLNVGLEQKVEARTRELAFANEELKAFNYTVSHDLRAPLRALTNYSQILLDDYADEIDSDAQYLLRRIHNSARKMSDLVSGLLDLSRIQSKQLERQALSLSDMAQEVVKGLQEAEPERACTIRIEPKMHTTGDKRMILSVLENLLGNAWKYSSKKEQVEITFGVNEQNGKTVYFIRDQGAGFDMRYRDKLFNTFQRLHHEKEFAGTGIGLATVKRIVNRHGGEVWAEAEVEQGATFFFTLG